MKFDNPLDNIRVASPCSADWNAMYGDERKRFCAACKLNVYNLSDMSRNEAENFLMASEGRVCVRYFRRSDGTVLTKDCPVGWQAVKQRVSRVATATFSLVVGTFFGLLGLRAADSLVSILPMGDVPAIEEEETRIESGGVDRSYVILGEVGPTMEVEGLVDLTEFRKVTKQPNDH